MESASSKPQYSPEFYSLESAWEGSSELQCVGKLEVVKPEPVLGFICGTLPVPTDHDFHSALVPSSPPSSSSQTVRAPRYQMLPTETDLNTPPLLSNSHEKAFPIAAMPAKASGAGDLQWENDLVCQNLARKCEALAVSGLAEYGDEIDVVAPADILKQIFKIPYSKARLSVAVHRIGQTLVLNTGPDIEEGEKLVRRQSNQSRSVDQSIFLNFAMHSVRAEACDCPPSHNVPSEDPSNSTILPGHSESGEDSFVSSAYPKQGGDTQLYNHNVAGSPKEGFRSHHAEFSEGDQDSFYWGSKQNKQKNRHATIKKSSQVGEKPRCPVQESEKYKRAGNDGFLRVLFWQFHNFRMLLGSDLLLFSNEKYVAVSLHLWDVTRQVTPLTWLEAWLDNVMASVPELAICYHENGVVQGYELLKTDDIYLLKGISEDGIPAFHPQVVQQNGLSVLRFLQDNCKQDPGAYWLYKSAGEDVVQLFDLSVLPKNHSSDNHDKGCSSLPSLMQKGRRDSLFSLGTLLYRLAHRLSLSKAPNNRAKCVGLFKKCLDFLDEQDHLVVRAHAHEQFARLILKCYEELDLTSESFLLESEVTVTDVEDESEFSLEMVGSTVQDKMPSQLAEDIPPTNDESIIQKAFSEASGKMTLEDNAFPNRDIPSSGDMDFVDGKGTTMDSEKESLTISTASPHMVQTVADPISSKLLAIHHVSQAIKSLRWKRQLENTERELIDQAKKNHDRSLSAQFSVCACGDADCIEVCDIREWLAKSKMDQKLWKLVLLLGESYLALAEAYKENEQLHQAMKVVRLACTLYGSMPRHLENAQFISSMVCSSSSLSNLKDKSGKRNSVVDGTTKADFSSFEECESIYQSSSNHLFWAKTWTLVGDIYVEYHRISGTETSIDPEKTASTELRVSNDVVKEVKRLKKKLGQFQQNCSMCSLINCSCQSDRASSGNSASSSSGGVHSMTYGRKQTRKLSLKNPHRSISVSHEDDHVLCNVENTNGSEGRCFHKNINGHTYSCSSQPTTDNHEVTCMVSESVGAEDSLEKQTTGHKVPAQAKPHTQDALKSRIGGIFKFLEYPVTGSADYSLTAAISCYDAARKALCGIPNASPELQLVVKKKGWACNELGRCRLDNRDLESAELAFIDAVKAFKEVSDHTNIILINCNLGHGRRALAEAMVSKLESLWKHGLFQNAYRQALETAKSEYCESLRYYGAARSELDFVGELESSVEDTLRNEVNTQYAHTYLKLGMLLAKEDTKGEVYESGTMEEMSVGSKPPGGERKKGLRRHEISANDAIREALHIYESLGELRKQEAAYAYFQLACYHRDCCKKFLDLDLKQVKPSRGEKVKYYASLAERNWQKSIDFYGPKTHPVMYLTILMERSALSLRLSSSFHSNAMLESALSQLLEGRHVVQKSNENLPVNAQHAEVEVKFWAQLQTLLKNMLAAAQPGYPNKSSVIGQVNLSNRVADAGKLKELYRMSLKPDGLSQLHDMYELWGS